MKVLLIAPYYDKTVPGESWSTYKWVEGISRDHDVTVLTTHKKGWNPEFSPTNAKSIVNWESTSLPKPFARLERELKPSYISFYFKARRWIKRALKKGKSFDLVHQINPLALRYPCPARGLGIIYLMGPLAGSVQTPEGFRNEASDKQWYRKLRNLDTIRIKQDPWLKRTYRDAHTILGVAPYVEKLLEPANIQRFKLESETGVEAVITEPKSPPTNGSPLRLLYVGRIIRTKGVIDAIRAVARLPRNIQVRFDIIGDGDMLGECKDVAAELGLQQTVTFHGRLPRKMVDRWYQRSHVFLFPSYREPSGNVVFEAMSHGLPVITTTQGGPGYLVNDECGIRVEVTTPERFSTNLSAAICEICRSNEQFSQRSRKTIKRISSLANWDQKIERMNVLYSSTSTHQPCYQNTAN